MAMTRQQAIDHIWQLSEQVSQEFCCSQRERDELVRETTDALAALELSPLAEAWDQGFTTCQLRVSQELLALLPKRIDAVNPYPKVVSDATD